MTGLLFIRHAETDMAGTFCGHSDPPINAAGQQQVAQMISTLTSESIDEIYSSDLRRAVDTANLLSQMFDANYKMPQPAGNSFRRLGRSALGRN